MPIHSCSSCFNLVPVVRKDNRLEALHLGGLCKECDEKVMTELSTHHNTTPGRADYIAQSEDFWAHPSVAYKLNKHKVEGFSPEELAEFEDPSGPRGELRGLEGGGTDPRKPDDPRPKLTLAGWKAISAINHGIDSTNNGCPCNECEDDRIKAEMRKNKILPSTPLRIPDDQMDDLHRGYYPESD